MGQREMTLKEIEKVRRTVKADILLSISLILLRLLIAWMAATNVKSDNSFIAWTGFAIGVGGAFFTYLVFFILLKTIKDFFKAWHAFYTRRYVPLLDNLLNEGYLVPWSVSKWRFFRVKSLEEFEKTLIDGLRTARRVIDLKRQRERWARVSDRLRPQLYALLNEFQVESKERAKAIETFNSHENPKRKREFLVNLGTKLAYDAWKTNPALIRQETPSQNVVIFRPSSEDIELRSLEARASGVVTPEAIILYHQGRQSEIRREKIRLFGTALQLDEKENRQEESARIKQDEFTPVERAEIKQTSLREFSRERLAIMESIIGRIADWKMCREVILVLLEPGRSSGRFNKRYFAEDTVKNEVRRQYQLNANGQFDPTTFDHAVKTLLTLGVLVSKPKTDERTLSLSTKVKGAPTPQAAEIIAASLRLKREATGFV